MASLLESLASSITPEMAGGIGKAFGLDENMVKQGFNVVAPLLQGGLAKAASTPQGQAGLQQALTAAQTAADSGKTPTDLLSGLLTQFGSGAGSKDMVGSLLNAAGGGTTTADDPISKLLGGIFGNGLGAVSGTLDKALGFRVSPLLAVAGPLLIGQISKIAKAQGMDTAGVAKYLQDQQKAFVDAGGPTVGLVQQAEQAGKAANALRERYSDQEWTKIRLSPLAATAVVMAASPSKGNAAANELAAGLGAIEVTKTLVDPVSLLSVAFDAPLSQDELKLFTVETPADKLLGAIKDASAVIASKDPTAQVGYATLINNVSAAVADASKEGGFLGIGGKRVSDAEQAALNQISAALGA